MPSSGCASSVLSMPEDVASPESTVLIVQRRLTHYRVPLFEALRSALSVDGVKLRLVVGGAQSLEATKADEGILDWAEQAPSHYLLGGRLCWQDIRPWLPHTRHVIVTQENRLLMNWRLLLAPGNTRVALWGHGRSFGASGLRARWAQALKASVSRRADWWFAYTAVSARTVEDFGYPSTRITTLNNTVDVQTLRMAIERQRRGDLGALRARLGLTDGPVGVFIGSLYAGKRLELLLAAARRVREAVPGFQLLIGGDGALAGEIGRSSAGLPWVHCLGPVVGERKAEILAVADAVLGPGALGLGILDAFAAGVPAVVAEAPDHGPEVEYLRPGVNGLLSASDVPAYATAIRQAVQDPILAERLRDGALASAREYTLQAMVERFRRGILAWRAAPACGKGAHS
jgi:glycosyltransferase involved in cell wall biosynthesis